MRKHLIIISALFFSLIQPIHQEAAIKSTHPYNFIHESFDNANLKELRDSYSFDEYVGKGKSEYERMILLKDWVYSKLEYSFKSPVPSLINSIEILRLAEKQEGKKTGFLCTSFAALYLQCALSLGWTARYVFLRRPTGLQHASVDIWSKQYKKWIYIDPTWNLHTEENGVPLSLIDIRNKWLNKRFGRINFIFSAGDKSEYLMSSDFPIRKNDSELWEKLPIDEGWLSYTFEIAIIGRNNFFTEGNIWNSNIYIIKDRHNQNDKSWPFRNQTPLPEDILFAPFEIELPEI